MVVDLLRGATLIDRPHSPARFAQFAEHIFVLAPQGIEAWTTFLQEIDCPPRLPELGIGDELLE